MNTKSRIKTTNHVERALKRMPIPVLSAFEAYYEASEKARREGRPGEYDVTDAEVRAKIREKKLQKAKSGRVTTTIRVGKSGVIEL